MWQVKLKRQLSNWEIAQWEQLQELLCEFQLNKELKDALIWKQERHGKSGWDGVEIGMLFGSLLGMLKEFLKLGMDVSWEIWIKELGKRVFFLWYGLFGKTKMKRSSEEKSGIHQCKGNSLTKDKKGNLLGKASEWTAKIQNQRGDERMPRLNWNWRYLRDSNGEVKILFSKHIDTTDSNEAEILAVREAFLIFMASQWKDNHRLLIESDSANVVKWINNANTAPWRKRKWVLQIGSMKKELTGWEIRHVLREANQRAGDLAKEGVLLQTGILRVF
ncbi:Uncharacterized protein TCM_015759 [Theobroma cacao]|uniref:RNase H type-1 domain-containing protein n=1 Tax=Theobroma cacao TaxID=3641 RepID=A0A061G4E3_THECC|nr:Uncharacterized protein TCM_015759 [Theobroma cacao]